MTAYVIFQREAPLTGQEAIEGEGYDGIVMVSFETAGKVKACYYDDYQRAVSCRRKAAPYRAYIVDSDIR